MPADLNLSLLLPEITIVAIVSFLGLLEIFRSELSRRFTTQLNLSGILLVAAALVFLLNAQGTAFGGMFTLDALALFFKFIFLAAAAWVFVVKEEDRALKDAAEFPLILWSALLGMFFLVSSKDFLLFFISLELVTLSIYILASYTRRNLSSIEAGLKYLILGSLASAFLLYGISLIYASSGTLSFDALREFAGKGGTVREPPLLFLAGSLLVLSALGFKVAAVPFQVWVPDVYQGAPTPVAGFLSVASKAAGFAALLRILFGTLGALDGERRMLFLVFASLTLLYGNLGALVQKNMKRLLGFSSIGHAGFLLIALAASSPEGPEALLYYLIAYGITNLTAFLIVILVEKEKEEGSIDSFRGLSRRSPLLAAGMFLAFLSLAGVPPLAGFFSKFFILLAAAKSELYGIVFLGAASAALSLYYYLNVIRVVYFEKAEDETPLSLSFSTRVLLFVLMGGMVLAGVWQAPFFRMASWAAHSLLI